MPLPYVDPNKPALLTREQFKSSLGQEKSQIGRVLAHDAAQREEIDVWKGKFYGLVGMLEGFKHEIEHIHRELNVLEDALSRETENNQIPYEYR